MELNEILINVGYDYLDKPNLYRYKIDPKWNFHAKTNIVDLLGNVLGNFNVNSVNNFINKNVTFIYPILLFDNRIFDNHNTIDFDENLVNYVKIKKCRIIFFYTTEGNFNNDSVNWINNLCIRYGFDKEDVVVVTANLIEFNNNNFIIYQYNHFGNHYPFLDLRKMDKIRLKSYENDYLKFLNHRNKLHFLCFNNVPRLNRVMMYNELNSNEKLIGKSISTLRTEEKNYYYDISDWENQKMGSGSHLNIQAHQDCFVNIVTETLFDNESIFLTEKIYKPIYLCQPFILFGNPYSLNKLKELGYKTFDNWWDESYDLEMNLDLRFKKIINVLEIISEWDMDKCYEIKKEMEEILIHNHKNMFNITETTKLFEFLMCGKKPKKSLI